MRSAILIALALLLLQEKNEAEELLKKAAEKVSKAETFQCASQIDIHGPPGKFRAEQSLYLAAGNRVRYECKIKRGAEEKRQLIVSDGKKYSVLFPEKKSDVDTPADFNEDIKAMIPRVSLMGAVEGAAVPMLGGGKAMESLIFSDFKLGKEEKSGERKLRSIHYHIKQTKPTRAVQTIDGDCVLWVDSETLLPVKRELTMKFGDKGDMIWIESFTDTKLNEKIDPAKFELPK